MINVTNNKEAKIIDEILIKEYLIPEQILMENAANSIMQNLPEASEYLIVCGPGNNGGDGLALARLLDSKDKKVKILCPYNKTIHYEICKKLNIEFITKIEESEIIIDAIFGVGIENEIKGEYKKIIDDINKLKNKKIISIDLETPGIKSDLVLMLSSFKESMLNSFAKSKVLDIGVNKKYYKKASNKYIVDDEYIKSIKIKKDPFANKGNFGKVAIYARNGAALLSVAASIKSGSGYTYLLSDVETLNANLIKNVEAMNFDETENVKADVYAIGPALGVDDKYLEYINKNIDKNLVLDADALNILAKNKEIIKRLNKECIITPHLVEFARLTGDKLDSLVSNPFNALKAFKSDFKGVVILKGKNNIIYDGENYYIVNIGNSKMANAGMGDTLTGMVASYKAQGYSSLNAAIMAVYRQAYIGRELSKENQVVNPSMIIEKLSKEF